MFYPALAAVPEWAPPGENHILYSEGLLKNVLYQDKKIQYNATAADGIEYLRLAFKPGKITLNGTPVLLHKDVKQQGYILKELGNGDYAVTIKRTSMGNIIITGF